MPGMSIHTKSSAAELRTLARRETRPRVALRLHAMADLLDGIDRAWVAPSCHGHRQVLRDASVRLDDGRLREPVEWSRSKWSLKLSKSCMPN